jgi:hypothetical protein
LELQNKVVEMILVERAKQHQKWGEQNHKPQGWIGILGEEFGELCEAINETCLDNAQDTHKGGYENIKREAIHTCAVALGFLECLERNKEKWEL